MDNVDHNLMENFYVEDDLATLGLSFSEIQNYNPDIDQQSLMTGNISSRDDLNYRYPLDETISGQQWATGDMEQQDRNGILGNIPTRDDFPGQFNFQLNINEATSGQHWVYSNKLQQLFIGMNKTLVIEFRMNLDFNNLNTNYYVVALPVYSTDEHVSIPVNRCTFHCAEDDPHSQAHQHEDRCLCSHLNKYVGHVVRAGEGADYKFDNRSKRHYVRVLVTPPQAGCDHIRIPYSFACKTSCPRGMQRRPIHVIFTLEDESGTVYGRQKIGVKICSCPKRDRKRQEQDLDNSRAGRGFGEKRKRPLVDDTVPEVVLSDTSYNPIPPIKHEEDRDPLFMQKSDVVAEIKREISQFKKIFSGVKDSMTILENKMNRISELNERLQF